MARAQSRRRVRHAVDRATRGAGATHALILLLSFLIGAVLDWVRHQSYSFTWGWRMETFVILVAAWLTILLLTRWPGHERYLARTAAVLLLMLFLGSLVIHVVLDHP